MTEKISKNTLVTKSQKSSLHVYAVFSRLISLEHVTHKLYTFVSVYVLNIYIYKVLKFADDIKVFRKIKSDADRQHLQDDLNKLIEWSEKWQMLFNPHRTWE